MKSQVGAISKQDFLPFSILAAKELRSIETALTRIRSGDSSECAIQQFFFQRQTELEKRYESLGKDYDFGVRVTLNEIDVAVEQIYKECKINR